MRVVAVACSGGRDSTALLHCTVRRGAALGVQVVALHVHHGLMPQADAWAAQVRAQAKRWGAGFLCERLQSRPQPGQSVEAWARTERHAALQRLAAHAGAELLLLAHHRQDQAETWLLQALRGAGAAGLAAMPRQALRGGIVWARPWLGLPRRAIESYVHRHRLRWVDDASNADPRFARSRLRHAVWPVLDLAFPGLDKALAGAASHAADAAALMEEVAAIDLPPLQSGEALLLSPWLQLPAARRANALRAWLHARGGAAAPRALVQRLLAELPSRSSARWPAGEVGELRLYRGRLQLHRAAAAAMQAGEPQLVGPVLLRQLASIDLREPALHMLAAGEAMLEVTQAATGGISLDTLAGACWRPRAAGDRFQRSPGSPPRSLKKQFQAAGVPAWQRDAPLLCAADGRLLFVPALGPDARSLAGTGEPQRMLRWLPLQGAAGMPTGAAAAPGHGHAGTTGTPAATGRGQRPA